MTKITLNFLKTKSYICVPVAGVKIESLLLRQPKKIKISDGILSLELGDDTAADVMSLL